MEEKKVTTYKCLYMRSEHRLYRARILDAPFDPWFEIVHEFSDGRLPIGMGGMVVDSRVYMVGGEKAKRDSNLLEWDPEDRFSSDSFVLNWIDGSLDRVRDGHFPSPSGCKTRPVVVTLEKKIYLLSTIGYFWPLQQERFGGPMFEVFDPVQRSWKNLPPPPTRTIFGYFAWGHKLLIYPKNLIFDARKGEWEDGRTFASRFAAKSAAVPYGAAVEFKGYLFATSYNMDAVVAFQLGHHGLVESHWVLHELDWVFRFLSVDDYGRPLLDAYGKVFLTDLGDGRMCLMLAESWHWHLHSVIFRVSILDGCADHPFSIHVESRSGFSLLQYDLIDSVFMCDHRNAHDSEADSSFTNLNPSGLDSSEDSKKRVVD